LSSTVSSTSNTAASGLSPHGSNNGLSSVEPCREHDLVERPARLAIGLARLRVDREHV
jgi:hypothetical protein